MRNKYIMRIINPYTQDIRIANPNGRRRMDGYCKSARAGGLAMTTLGASQKVFFQRLGFHQ